MLCHNAGDTVIGAALGRYGEWAEEELYLLSRTIQPGAVVLDVGANVGTHTLAFSRFVGPAGQVLSFDGQRRAFQLLGTNVALNRCSKVKCFNVLVGATSALSFVRDMQPVVPDNLGSTSFANIAWRDDATTRTDALTPLATITIDDLCLERCDLIKIDVEGMEFEVLSGAVETIRRCGPTLYFEQTSIAGLGMKTELLRACGYRLYWHVAHPFNANNFHGQRDNIFGPTREVNILAIPRSRPDLIDLACCFGLASVAEAFPTLDASALEQDWALPSFAYDDVELPFCHRVGVRSFDDVLPGVAGWGTTEPALLAQLQADFRNLEHDRRKAQEIMEYLSDQVTTMSGEIKSLRRATQPVSA